MRRVVIYVGDVPIFYIFLRWWCPTWFAYWLLDHIGTWTQSEYWEPDDEDDDLEFFEAMREMDLN